VTKLILHIGAEKTGSTALQSFLRRHEKALFVHGIIFPSLFQTVNAGELYLSGVSSGYTDYLDNFLFKRNKQKRHGYIRQLSREISRIARGRYAETCILSSELLYSRLHSVDELRRLKSNLLAEFESIQVICYVRNQAELALGMSIECVKEGRYLAQILSPLDNAPLNYSCDYKNSLSNWLEAFPGEVVVRRYERDSLLNGDIIDDFLSVIGRQELMGLAKPLRANRSLTNAQVQVLNYLNSKNVNHEKNGPIIKSLLNSLSDEALHGKMRPTSAIARCCEQRYQESDEWVRSMFFPGDHALWTKTIEVVDSQSLMPHDSMASIIDLLVAEQNKREFLFAQLLSKLLRPRQFLSLFRAGIFSYLAAFCDLFPGTSFNLYLLRARAFVARLKYKLWSFRGFNSRSSSARLTGVCKGKQA
jgi:hypothetical protein